ncbi:MAG TPA: hypothetical protein VL200_09765 [Lacunisphaera sp.]|jgi:hypothetical protein|nr:hypothetical protein [Lacunisphaera sp.]
MKTTESEEDVEIESPVGRAARLTFLSSLGFWPLFLFAAKFMLDPPAKTTAAIMERNVLVDGTWIYPVTVIAAWLLAKRGMRLGRSDLACVLPWVLPALLCCYWPVYYFVL